MACYGKLKSSQTLCAFLLHRAVSVRTIVAQIDSLWDNIYRYTARRNLAVTYMLKRLFMFNKFKVLLTLLSNNTVVRNILLIYVSFFLNLLIIVSNFQGNPFLLKEKHSRLN